MIILTHSTQTGKNYGFLFCLVIEAVKIIAGCACLETWGTERVSLGIYMHQAKNTFKSVIFREVQIDCGLKNKCPPFEGAVSIQGSIVCHHVSR